MRSALARSNNNTSTKYEEHEWFITISDEYFSTMEQQYEERSDDNNKPKAKPKSHLLVQKIGRCRDKGGYF